MGCSALFFGEKFTRNFYHEKFLSREIFNRRYEKMPKEMPPGRKKIKQDVKKVVIAITMDPALIEWAKEWAARRERSFSWAVNYFVGAHRNKELAEKHLGQKVVR
jgi:hypothetical protein